MVSVCVDMVWRVSFGMYVVVLRQPDTIDTVLVKTSLTTRTIPVAIRALI